MLKLKMFKNIYPIFITGINKSGQTILWQGLKKSYNLEGPNNSVQSINILKFYFIQTKSELGVAICKGFIFFILKNSSQAFFAPAQVP